MPKVPNIAPPARSNCCHQVDRVEQIVVSVPLRPTLVASRP